MEHFDTETFEQLTKEYDDETGHWSVGHDRHRHFETLINLGGLVVPSLISEMNEGRSPVWRTQVLIEASARYFGIMPNTRAMGVKKVSDLPAALSTWWNSEEVKRVVEAAAE